jgi:5-methylthioadenosine/S-adenosylhomocysteine deaminase
VAAATVRLVGEAVVTLDEADRVLCPGALDLNGDRIVWVGPPEEAPAGDVETRRVGGLLMPGLVNAHGHTPMTLLRGAGDGLPLERWLHDVVFPREAQLAAEDVYWGMLLGAAEQLTSGVTTTAEMYFFAGALAEAASEAGIRCALAPAIIDRPDGPPEARWPAFLADAEAVHKAHDGEDGRLRVDLGPHSAYLLPDEALAAVAESARRLGATVQIHVAETAAEEAGLEARRGRRAPELLEEVGLFEARVLAAHSVWLDDVDLDRYARHDVAVAHCPQSNGKLGSGIARVPAMLAAGLRVGLGTDGPASNDSLDLWGELRLAPTLARASATDAGALGTLEALRLATSSGAAALGLATGRLAAGHLADVVRLDLEDSRLGPALDPGDLVAHVVWSASSRLVTDVWVGGRQVVVDRRCTTVDVAGARAEVRARARRLRDAAAS